MLEIDVKDVLTIHEQSVVDDVCVIVVHLQGHRGVVKGVIPATQNVAAAEAAMIGIGA